MGAICPDPKRDRIFLGDNLGRVYETDAQLGIRRTLQLPGRITGLAVLDDGSLAVCYGTSALGPDYHLTIVDPARADGAPAGTATGFYTLLLATDGTRAIYSTVNARLGAVDAHGHRDWEQVLTQRPFGIAVSTRPETAIVVADRKGVLSLLGAGGNLHWRRQVSRVALKQVAFSPDERMIVASDRNGRIFVVNRAGQLLYGDGRLVHRSSLAGFVHDGQDILAIAYEGGMQRIRLAGATPLRRAGDFRLLRRLCAVVLPLALVLLVIGGSARLTDGARRFLVRLHAGRVAYCLLLPTFILLCIFNYYPVVTAFTYSFTNFSLSKPIEFVGLDNFRQMLHDRYLWVGIGNMLIFLGAGLLKTLTMPFLVAELVFWLQGERLKRFFRSAFVVPTIVPGLVMILLWAQIYHPDDGLLNRLLVAAGLEEHTHAWLAEEGLALWAIIFSGFPWVGVFAFLILLGGLIGISSDIYEAAEIDGIGVWDRLWRIDVPLVMPQVKLLIVFVFIGSIQDFTAVLIFTDGGPGMSTYVPALQMFKQIADGANLGYAAAIGLVLFALVLVATVVNLKLIRTHE